MATRIARPSLWFAAAIRQKRIEAELSVAEMARVVGAHRNTYRLFELGQTEPSFSQGLKLVEFFKMNIFEVTKEIKNGD